MSLENELLRDRIRQLEEQARQKGWEELGKPDPSLAHDEWWATFSDWRSVETGLISKIPPMGMAGNASLFKVKRVL